MFESNTDSWGLFGTCMVTGKLCLLARNIPDDSQHAELWPNYCGFLVRPVLAAPLFEDRAGGIE